MNAYDCLALMMRLYAIYTRNAAPVRQHQAFWGKMHTIYAQNNTSKSRLDRHSSNISWYLMKMSHKPPVKNR